MRLDAVVTGLMGVAGSRHRAAVAEFSGTPPAFEYSIGAFFIAYGVGGVRACSR